MSFRIQLLLAFIYVILLGLAGITIVAGRQLAAGALEDFESQLQIEALLIASALHEPVEEYFEVEADRDATIAAINVLAQSITKLARETNTQITVVHLDGEVWLSTDSTIGETLGDTPEFQAALEEDIIYTLRDNLQGQPILYSAAAIVDHNAPMAIAHISAPAAIAQAAVRQRWIALGSAFAAISVAAVLVSLYLSKTFTRPLKTLEAAAMKLADGDLQQRVAIERPAEIRAVGKSFNQMAAQVEYMLQEQRAFASNASHELRTPLTTTRLRLERLRTGKLTPEKETQYLIEIDQELLRLSRLVEDLGILSRADSQRLERGKELIDPKRVAKALLVQYADEIERKNLNIELTAIDDVLLEAALTHYRLVFRNLLDNAIKYTPVGGQIHWEISKDDSTTLRNVITDTGIGITPEAQPNIFKRFYRADESRNRQQPGTGLGLSLVQSVLALYSAEITIESAGFNQGTTVTVQWPLK